MEEHAPIIGAVAILVIAGLFGPYFAGSWGGLMEREGGYSKNPNDLAHQGEFDETNKGVTERTARAHDYWGAMIDLPDTTAARIAYEGYWKPMRIDDILAIDSTYMPVANRLFDMAYHMGTYRAGVFFQTCLNVFNNQGRRYADIAVDGRVGRRTLAAFSAYHRGRRAEGVGPLDKCLEVQTGAFYMRLAENRPDQETFAYGWIRRLVELEE